VVAGKNYELIKLVDGTADSIVPVPATVPADASVATRPGLWVNGHLMLFNGTGWDRARGSIANGLVVDVSRVQGAVQVAGTVTVGNTIGAPVPVEVVSGGGGGTAGTEYQEGATDSTITGPALMWEDTADTLRVVSEAKPLPVNVVAGGGGGGAGTEYQEGVTDATITGTALMWEDAADTLRAVSVAKPLPVVQTGALPAGAANIGDVDVLTVPADPFGLNSDAAASVGGVASISAKLRLVTQQLNTLAVTGSPVAAPATDVNGRVTRTDTAAADVIAAQAASRTVVTSIVVVNGSATVDTKVEILDGATVKLQGFAAKAGGGWSASGAPLLIGTTNTALRARCATTGADVDVFVGGYRT